MRSNDIIKNKNDILQSMQQALKDNDAAAYTHAMDELTQFIGDSIRQDFESLQGEQDARVLASRGIRQLTSEERKYYQAFITAAKSSDPKQAISNLGMTLPETVLEEVFDDLATEHPLLSKINFIPSRGNIRMLIGSSDNQAAAWGDLCDEVVKEILASFTEVDAGLLKLSAFLPVCKSMLDLGPEWIDRFVRQVLYEALANALEAGIITGTGKKMPIGMDRQVGNGVSVVDGVYPQKEKTGVTDLSAETVGNLLSKLAVGASGKPRKVRDVLFIVNPQDYYSLVMPATTVQAPDGTYRNDVLPYPMTVIQSNAIAKGEAIIGLANRYFATAGSSTNGTIEYSDHYQFLEDNRVYLIKLYANGFPRDNTSFLRLDISGLKPAVWRVQQVAASEP